MKYACIIIPPGEKEYITKELERYIQNKNLKIEIIDTNIIKNKLKNKYHSPHQIIKIIKKNISHKYREYLYISEKNNGLNKN